MNNPERNHTIDLLRILAAAWVAVFHFNQPVATTDNGYFNFCKHGHLGVPVFFVISGYCINIACRHAATPGKFLIRRLFRIYPAYWFSLLVVLSCVAIKKLVTGTNSVTILPHSFTDIINIILLNTKPLSTTETINWVYWSLSYEVIFYLLIFGALFVPTKLRNYFLLLLVALCFIMPIHTEGLLTIVSELPLFMAGFGLYNSLNNKSARWLNLIIAGLSITAAIYKHQGQWGYLIAGFATIALISLNQWVPLKNNILSRLGDYSYSLYLIHVPVGIGLLGFVKTPAIQENIMAAAGVDLAMLAFLTFLATLMYKYIELPAINYGKRLKL